MKLVHIKEIVVSDEHLDQNNHVNNVGSVPKFGLSTKIWGLGKKFG